MENLKKEIEQLKQEKNAVLLAHYYVDDAVQEIADSIRKSGKHDDWINEFEIKYGLNKQQMANTRS